MKRLFTILIFGLPIFLLGQNVMHQVFLLGNLANSTNHEILLAHLESNLDKEIHQTILVLGDLTDENGINKDPSKENKGRLKWLEALDDHKRTDVYFVGGDRDWDNNGPKGMEKIKNLEDYIEKNLKMKKAFIPSDACPGPKVLEVSDEVVIIAINSQWFLHHYDKPASPDTDCSILTELDFMEELDDLLEDYDDKNVLIMAHHPIVPMGKYGGFGWESYHLLPFIGSFYNSFRKYIGTSKDLSNEAYNRFANRLNGILDDHHSIIYASGHEHHSQIMRHHDNYHINASASEQILQGHPSNGSIHLINKPAYYCLNYFDDGRVESEVFYNENGKVFSEKNTLLYSGCQSLNTPINKSYEPCAEKETKGFHISRNVHLDTSIVAGPEYQGGKVKRFWMGDQYREEWTTKVKAPFLNLDSIGGGLKPYARGGGLQTFSLKFKGKDKQKYVFRQVNKHPEKALSSDIRKTIYRDITKDLITSQHPYGGLVASQLMERLGILHAPPVLFAMPDDTRLGDYREEFVGTLGTLELRPKGKTKKSDGFYEADKVVKSNQMFRSMYKDARNRIDKQAYARARVFDLWVGDWDRHEDNWIWAQYDEGKGNRFVPIPKDRDHVFSQWTGIIPSIADMVVMNAENFDYEFGNIVHLSFKARHLDRQLANEITKDDWSDAVQFLQQHMDDNYIEKSVMVLPQNIFDLNGNVIIDKLKSRRDQLNIAAEKLYNLLSKEVDIIGSNDEENFVITTMKNGGVRVEMWRIKDKDDYKEQLYNRIFSEEETEAINIYGLSGKDQFVLKGENQSKIKVRLIGGDKHDRLINENENPPKHICFYDTKQEDDINGPFANIKRPKTKPDYNNRAFEYNGLFPLPEIKQSSGNGFGFGANISKIIRGFNKPEFSSIYGLYGVWYPGIGAYRLEGSYKYRHFVGLYDLKIKQHFSTFYDQFPFYYGIGSRTEREEERLEENYYRLDFITAKTTLGLERSFWRKSEITYLLTYAYNDVHGEDEESTIFIDDDIKLLGEEKLNIFGAGMELKLDFRDNESFPKFGSLLESSSQIKTFQSDGTKTYGKLEMSLAQYQTYELSTEITFSVRIGGMTTLGDAPFYEMSVLGSNSYLRGYTRNRFLDKHALFYNLESRIHLGTINTVIAPIRLGVFGFYDSGKVWGVQSFSDNIWNDAYGGGLYIAPIKDLYNINFYLAQSRDKGLYFDYRMGWRF